MMWIYQGLVPKLLGPHADELSMNQAFGLALEEAIVFSYAAGIAEILMGIMVVVFWRRAWPLHITILAMLGLLAYVMVMNTHFLFGAFNPVIMNVGVVIVAWFVLKIQFAKQMNYKK